MIACPDLIDQRTIAAFLDRETRKIDALVAKKEELIELLQEKRTALATHAVTKGLDPHAPMKNSGIEWLGDIPQSWEIKRIKFLLREMTDTEHKTVPFVDGGAFLVARTSDVKNGHLEVTEASKFTDLLGYNQWTRRGRPSPGDILFTREAPAGEACLVPDQPALCLGQRMVLFRVDRDLLDGSFGIHGLYGGLAREFVEVLSQGSTVPHFNMADIGSIPVATPRLREQVAISAYLDEESDRLDELIKTVRGAIEKLRELRTALISAAVTGKIDVREEVA